MPVCILCNMQEDVAREFNVPIQFQRYWLWAKRQNHTYRPNRPLTQIEEAQSVNSHACIEIFLFILYFIPLPSPFPTWFS